MTDFSIFSNGLDAAAWAARNCDLCVKGFDDARGDWCCPLEEAIDLSGLDDGRVGDEIASRLAIDHLNRPAGRCPEFVRAEFPAPAPAGMEAAP